MKLKKKIRKRLMKPVRKLVKQYGPVIAAELVTAVVAAAAARRSGGTKPGKRRASDATATGI
ncbi:hypothetical protein [Longimicrobium sp.]|uniref:hypothetical protein n=1 Tax=Longimicrobium sp. TaxID=2029185 RepID=UPI003B3A4BCA